MMAVTPAQQIDVQRHSRMIRKSLEKVLGQFNFEIVDSSVVYFNIVNEVGTAANIAANSRQRFVHGDMGAAVTDDTQFVRAHLRDGLSQTYADVFDTVMEIDFMISLAIDSTVKEAVYREQRQHMVQKGVARRNMCNARSLYGEFTENFRFLRRAFNRGFSQCPRFHRLFLSIGISNDGRRDFACASFKAIVSFYFLYQGIRFLVERVQFKKDMNEKKHRSDNADNADDEPHE